MSLHFELVSPERLLLDIEVLSVVVPGAEGDFMVLPDHAPVMSTIRPGVVKIIEEGKNKPVSIFVRGGFAEVTPGSLVILAEEAIPLTELNKASLKQKIIDAREDIEDAKSDEERRMAEEATARLTELLATLD